MKEMVEKYWNALTKEERNEILKKNGFWDGLKHYLFEFIPNDLKDVIAAEIAEKEEN